MATSKTTNTYNRQNWEDAEFPILCQTCLGDNPYIRMTKERYGKECKICMRPFTVFRWCPGARMRFKKTEVCQTCSRLKNVCQTCLLDLEYGLPIQVRDAALKIKDDLPRSDVNKEYYVQNIDNEIGKIDPTTPAGAVGKSAAASDLLMKLARTSPYYKRNRPHICSFWVKGECKRGEECPYRHEKPTDPDDPLADQNIKDRYYGVNDPVADKLMRRAAAMPKLEPPEDKSITTLYVGNLGEVLTENQLRDHFYQYGEIRVLTMVPRQQCAFIQYTQRSAAETAAEKTFNKLIIGGRRLTIKWGRSQGRQTVSAAEATRELFEPVPGLPGALPPPPEGVANNFFNLQTTSGMMPPPPMMIPPPPVAPQFMFPPQMTAAAAAATPIFPPGTTPIHYPSQDPSRMGASQGIGKPWPEEQYNMQLRPGELTVDRFDMIEDRKGNAGDLGRLIVTNLRLLWHSLNLPRINLSIGFNTFVTVNSKILHSSSVHNGYVQALHILTSFRNCRYEFIFTNHDTKSTRHYTSVVGVYRAYVSSKIYREIKLRSGIILENRLTLLPHEKVHSSVQDVWNLSIEQGNIGTFIITNIRLVWYADVNHQFNVSIPYLTIANITIRTSKFGPTLVILSTEASGGYVLGFRINPLQQLHVTHKEISVLHSEFVKFPIFGVEYTFEHQAPLQEEVSVEHFTEIQDNQAEISNVFGYYFSEGETGQRKPNFSIHLGLAAEEPREGSTLQSLWELVPSTVN